MSATYSPSTQTPTIDPRLLAAITGGSCVAFVGAGFSAAAELPPWRELIMKLAAEDPDGSMDEVWQLVRSLVNSSPRPSSRELEMAAQLLFDALGEEIFCQRLARALDKEALPDLMRLRLKHLLGIPFRAIVTTNFDPILPGISPSAQAYRRMLRPQAPSSPWREAIARVALGLAPLCDTTGGCGNLIVQLHGRVDDSRSLVMTRSQYRHRLYGDSAYLTVLRSLLATSTVLFLGYSLSDAYLNEMRSELVEAFRDQEDAADPLAWAVIEGVSSVACRYYERHEGLGVVAYQAGNGGRDHSAFDSILCALYQQTNPVHRLGALLAGRRVLWFDPLPDNNGLGRRLLSEASREYPRDGGSSGPHLVEVTDLESAWRQLSGNETFDLVISHWGHSLFQGVPNGEELLRRVSTLRASGKPMPPVIIFAGPHHQVENRRRAFGLGAAEFVSRWEDLMAMIETLLSDTGTAL